MMNETVLPIVVKARARCGTSIASFWITTLVVLRHREKGLLDERQVILLGKDFYPILLILT